LSVDERVQRIEVALGRPGAIHWFRAPGRVNLMGDHTDYNQGFVLPMAIDRDCLIGVRARLDGCVTVRSLDVPPGESVIDVAADGGDEPAAVMPPWGRYVAGVVRTLAECRRPAIGLEAVLSSTVPAGSGLSSSAALEIACALALCSVAELDLPTRELAAACRRAEEIATGVPCGIMDQLASLAGSTNAALLLDCRSLDVEPVPVPGGIAVLAVHSGMPRALVDSAYAERRAACEAAAERLGLRALRDAGPVEAAADPYARHVVSENGRVLETAAAFRAGELDRLGPLFAASHASLRDDFRVSTPELDALVDALVTAGALGARLTGAGFGGCVVALVRQGDAARVADEAGRRYHGATGLEPTTFRCHAVAGAGQLDPPTK
jgi:galactokinase